MDLTDRILLAALAAGLPLSERPYRDLGEKMGLDEDEVIRRVARLQESRVIRRMGIVVRHHELGWRANAMVVWDIPDDLVSEMGRRLGACPEVTLCYRRPRRPGWPYNLFTMIHGRDRTQVEDSIAAMAEREGVAAYGREVLFSVRRFKQCGARHFNLQAAE